MNKHQLVDRLLELPRLIGLAEEAFIETEVSLRNAKDVLREKEDSLLNSGVIDGKNESIRSAQLRSFTSLEREAVMDGENQLLRVKSELGQLHNEFRALQAVAYLLSNEVA